MAVLQFRILRRRHIRSSVQTNLNPDDFTRSWHYVIETKSSSRPKLISVPGVSWSHAHQYIYSFQEKEKVANDHELI